MYLTISSQSSSSLFQMLPEVCAIDDLHAFPQGDSDCTLTKRRSFGDQYLLFVRQNMRNYMENNFPPGRESIRDMVIIQDESLPPLQEILHRIDYVQLSTLYLVDCRLRMDNVDVFQDLSLRALVLSHAYLRHLPRSIFEMDSLEVLKVDRNSLEEIPAEIGNLRNLKSFCCDSQRPRLRSLPHSITKLEHLEVLSFSNNRIENIAWVVALPKLRVLRCSNNRISRLPNQLVNLQELMVLDFMHNRLDYIPASFTDLLGRLYRFHYFNLTLRPKHIMRSRAELLSYLDLESFLAQSPVRRTGRDVSVAVVGESHSGKSTLVEALKADRGICKHDVRQESTFEIHQFEMQGHDHSCYISTLVLANDILDTFSKNISVDLYLLAVDLTALELQNGSQHLFARHVSRMQMWLQSLYDVAPHTPVVIVGTHAELVKSMAFGDIWHNIESILDQSRHHHVKRFTDSRLSTCILCNPKSLAVRHVLGKSRQGSAGFVDLSFPTGEPMMNGHVPTGDSPSSGKGRYPHIVGYYEIDSKKNLPKDAKKSNLSIEQLKGAIFRLTHNQNAGEEGIPPSWLSFIRQMSTITEQAPNLPCLPYEEVVSMSRSIDISPAQVPYMLKYFHQRGKLVYFANDEILSKLVVINPTWFIQVLCRVLDGFERSKCNYVELIESLQDKELDRQLHKAGVLSVASAHWLLAALQRLDLCVPVLDNGDIKLYLLPNLLEVGHPSQDVWPDLPEWDEKQITCDFAIRSLKPCLFSDLILRLNNEGRRSLEVVGEPAPVFLSHHIVFYTGIDLGGCDDCYAIRRRLRVQHKNDDEDEVEDDVLHKVHIHLMPNMKTIRIAVRGVSPCCTMKSVLTFIELYLDDIPEEDTDGSSDRTSVSSHALSIGPSASVSSDRGSMTSKVSHLPNNDEEDDRQTFLLCPKCVLLRHSNPERISYQTISPKRKAICSRWHNLGSWTRAVTGDYRYANDFLVGSSSLSMLPDYEHPRLAMIVPPSTPISNREWYMFSRTKFLEGFEVHFLCEYTGYWHMVEDAGFRLNQTRQFTKKVGNHLPAILNMALPMVQIVNGVHEHSHNGRLLAPVVADLIKNYEYLRNVDTHIRDPYTWLSKNKDRVVTMLTKVLANASDGFPDLYFKVGNSIHAEMVFQAAPRANRYELAKFLRIEASSGRFGPLRPLYVGQEIRWLCDAHYEELRGMPSK